jgi:hypothetical protein
MSVLAIIVSIVVVLVVAVLVIAATRPDIFRVSRSAIIRAPADRIFPLINDLRAHESWSSFDKPDPAVSKVHSGAPEGTGAVYEWKGKGQAGAGRLAITRSMPSSTVEMQLDMLKPFKASNQVVFTLQPKGDATEVTWAMQGHTPFLGRIMHLFFNMDRMVDGQFEIGLGQLASLAAR